MKCNSTIWFHTLHVSSNRIKALCSQNEDAVYYIPQNVTKYILSNINFYLNVVNVDSGI